MKKAILSLDVEDWYHLDYFRRSECDTSQSLLDGLDRYVDLINELSLPSSFFVLGEIAEKKIGYLKNLVKLGHDVGSHGWDHRRPMTMSPKVFQADLHRCLSAMKIINGDRGFGYRAPCFSLDRERLEIVRRAGFAYDSSRINFGNHPLYGTIDMLGFQNISESIYKQGDFVEFEATTLPILGNNIPISGGGYLRIFPWLVMKSMIAQHLKKNDIYVFYIHPFELSPLPLPKIPASTSPLTRFRFSCGRTRVVDRVKKLTDLLQSRGYEFTTFSAVQQELASSAAG
ncbi:MAG: polysaccharide deacetylase [Legionellales bacterium]|nr:polysaccharide deacetylase [Legionellales bacterium]